MTRPLCIDLFCGLGGWTDGFLAEKWDVVGFDIERHEYGEHRYPAQLVLQDVLTLHGSQFRHADCIVASPPCQEFSYMAMPWRRGKQIEAALRGRGEFPEGYAGSCTIAQLTALFDACFRIQREACEAAGRHIPMVVENVVGAQRWVGRAAWHHGSFYLWGDVPAVMPIISRQPKKATKGGNGSWFNIAHGKVIPGNCAGHPTRGDGVESGVKTVGHANLRDGHSHTRHLTNQRESDAVKCPGMNWSDRSRPAQGFNVTNAQRYREAIKHGGDCFSDPNWPGKQGGVKQGGSGAAWFDTGVSRTLSELDSRKAASALIAKIPFRAFLLHCPLFSSLILSKWRYAEWTKGFTPLWKPFRNSKRRCNA